MKPGHVGLWPWLHERSHAWAPSEEYEHTFLKPSRQPSEADDESSSSDSDGDDVSASQSHVHHRKKYNLYFGEHVVQSSARSKPSKLWPCFKHEANVIVAPSVEQRRHVRSFSKTELELLRARAALTPRNQGKGETLTNPSHSRWGELHKRIQQASAFTKPKLSQDSRVSAVQGKEYASIESNAGPQLQTSRCSSKVLHSAAIDTTENSIVANSLAREYSPMPKPTSTSRPKHRSRKSASKMWPWLKRKIQHTELSTLNQAAIAVPGPLHGDTSNAVENKINTMEVGAVQHTPRDNSSIDDILGSFNWDTNNALGEPKSGPLDSLQSIVKIPSCKRQKKKSASRFSKTWPWLHNKTKSWASSPTTSPTRQSDAEAINRLEALATASTTTGFEDLLGLDLSLDLDLPPPPPPKMRPEDLAAVVLQREVRLWVHRRRKAHHGLLLLDWAILCSHLELIYGCQRKSLPFSSDKPDVELDRAPSTKKTQKKNSSAIPSFTNPFAALMLEMGGSDGNSRTTDSDSATETESEADVDEEDSDSSDDSTDSVSDDDHDGAAPDESTQTGEYGLEYRILRERKLLALRQRRAEYVQVHAHLLESKPRLRMEEMAKTRGESKAASRIAKAFLKYKARKCSERRIEIKRQLAAKCLQRQWQKRSKERKASASNYLVGWLKLMLIKRKVQLKRKARAAPKKRNMPMGLRRGLAAVSIQTRWREYRKSVALRRWRELARQRYDQVRSDLVSDLVVASKMHNVFHNCSARRIQRFWKHHRRVRVTRRMQRRRRSIALCKKSTLVLQACLRTHIITKRYQKTQNTRKSRAARQIQRQWKSIVSIHKREMEIPTFKSVLLICLTSLLLLFALVGITLVTLLEVVPSQPGPPALSTETVQDQSQTDGDGAKVNAAITTKNPVQ